MQHYYLLNGTVKKGGEMPEKDEWYSVHKLQYKHAYTKWLSSLQPCDISESEFQKIERCIRVDKGYVVITKNEPPIDITDIVEEKLTGCNDCHKNQGGIFSPDCCNNIKSKIYFKQPIEKQVDGEIEAVKFAEWCDKQVTYIDENGNVDYKQLYEIFKNR